MRYMFLKITEAVSYFVSSSFCFCPHRNSKGLFRIHNEEMHTSHVAAHVVPWGTRRYLWEGDTLQCCLWKLDQYLSMAAAWLAYIGLLTILRNQWWYQLMALYIVIHNCWYKILCIYWICDLDHIHFELISDQKRIGKLTCHNHGTHLAWPMNMTMCILLSV